VPDLVGVLQAHAHRHVAHVLHARADDDVVHARRDEGRREVHGLLRGAALAVDGGRRRLDRQARLQPRVAGDVEALLAELLDAARDDVLDLGRIDAGAFDDRAVRGREQRVGVDVAVVALLAMPTPDRRSRRFDDDDLSTRLRHELQTPLGRARDDDIGTARPVAGAVF
jgi:hypothetical protein